MSAPDAATAVGLSGDTREDLPYLGAGKAPPTTLKVSFSSDVTSSVRNSLRANRVPAVLSFLLGVALVVVYYGGGAATRPAFESLGKMRSAEGIVFSMVSTCLSGGVLPSMLQATLGLLPRPRLGNVLFNVVLWLFLGWAVDRLYYYQAVLFGDEADAVIIVKKVLFDQFVWNVLLAVPFLSLIFRWRDHEFSLLRWREIVQPRAWALAYWSMLITCWGTWIPGTSVVYSFPADLQIPAFNIILLMYSSLISLVSQRVTQSSRRASEDADGADGGSTSCPTADAI